MLLPYASDFVPKRRPWITVTLMVVMLALTLLTGANERWRLPWAGKQLLQNYGIVPIHFNPISLFTYTLFHDGYGHLLINCCYLWVFGVAVEAAVGRLRYLLLFFLGGAIGGLLQWLVTAALLPAEMNYIPIVGASAACAGLVGLFAVRYYRARLAFIGLPFRIHVVAAVSIVLGYEMISALFHLMRGDTAFGVAHWAHIGGFVFGLGCAYPLKLGEEGSRAYLNEDAAQAMQSNQPGAAIKRWDSLLAREPENADAWRELAQAWLAYGDDEQAAGCFLKAIRLHLKANRRDKAAVACAEMFRAGIRETEHAGRKAHIAPAELFSLACALEEMAEPDIAAEAFRVLLVRNPNLGEAEPALAKVIYLYAERLNRREEAKVFGRLFLQRYPNSEWRGTVESALRGDKLR